ncbi:plant/F17J16-140 protein [Medicago truncatula]|uniref:Plant/F17J16-140 protein n=1 Tax=Medicago truncatula TaxID=3880 RepID=A0A072UFF3_MEDTR|nr:plant/F17J16-140 protein [Medicago truncatula]
MTEDWNCFTVDLIILNVALACVDGFIAFIAFAQVLRIHMRSRQIGWTRQKVLHIMVATSNLGYCVYFASTVFATCNGWYCWYGVCGFILMASPKVMFLAAFLLLLSFWVDHCHQENEEELDDEDNVENRTQQALLEGMREQHGLGPIKSSRRCCSIQGVHIGSRQKYVVMIVVLIFAVMMAFAILICVGNDTNPIDPSIVARVYESFLAVMIIILAGALGCYGKLLCILFLPFMTKYLLVYNPLSQLFSSPSIIFLFRSLSILQIKESTIRECFIGNVEGYQFSNYFYRIFFIKCISSSEHRYPSFLPLAFKVHIWS